MTYRKGDKDDIMVRMMGDKVGCLCACHDKPVPATTTDDNQVPVCMACADGDCETAREWERIDAEERAR